MYLKTEDEFTNSGTEDFIYFEFTYWTGVSKRK